MPPRFSENQSGQSWRFRDYLCQNKRHPAPTPVEVECIASDMVINDGKGDIVSTDRGFSLYRGLGPDGYTNDFLRVPNPLSSRQP